MTDVEANRIRVRLTRAEEELETAKSDYRLAFERLESKIRAHQQILEMAERKGVL